MTNFKYKAYKATNGVIDAMSRIFISACSEDEAMKLAIKHFKTNAVFVERQY